MTTRSWTDATGDQNPYNAGNWSPAGAPVIGDILVQTTGTMTVPGGTLEGDPLFLGAPQSGGLALPPAQLNLTDNAAVSVVVGPSAGATSVNHFANISVSGTDGVNLVSGPTRATNVTAIGLQTGSSLVGNIFLSGGNILDIAGDSTTDLSNSQVNVGNGTFAKIDAHSLGTDKFTVGFLGSLEITQPVDAGATVSLLANSRASLTLLDPLDFKGTVNFANATAGVGTTTTPSVIGLIGVHADSYAFVNNVLTLFAAGQVTDTLNLAATAGRFGVFNSASGVVVTSSNTTSVASSLHALPLHT